MKIKYAGLMDQTEAPQYVQVVLRRCLGVGI